MTAETHPSQLPDDDALFRLLRQLDLAPEASQRAIADALGISLGRLNANLHAVRKTGLIRVTEREGPDRRKRFTYALTLLGAAEKARLAGPFLARKRAEYDALHAELTGNPSGLVPTKHRSSPMLNNLAPIPELYVSYESAQKLKAEAGELASHDLTPRQICDLELLMNGGFTRSRVF